MLRAAGRVAAGMAFHAGSVPYQSEGTAGGAWIPFVTLNPGIGDFVQFTLLRVGLGKRLNGRRDGLRGKPSLSRPYAGTIGSGIYCKAFCCFFDSFAAARKT